MNEKMKEFIKENNIRNQETKKTYKNKKIEWISKTLVHLYLASPSKVQFALARYGVKTLLKKKKSKNKDLIRH